ncbi:IclR family transcriptional regulator [Novosphingobium endophyticum]|uniref:IclR family transcriptional regulator n=1 Tax=Novosphingobium endophyticum TaxID=1955250 RepID=UPI00227A6791|nr:IclR family transcriptional regulator [Novosphingobium endophyticum]
MASSRSTKSPAEGPRAGVRSLETLMTLATRKAGMSISDLVEALDLPRASLHRLLRLLESEGFLANQSGYYSLGQKSFSLARLIDSYQGEAEFPACARPVIEQLARKAQETVILGTLSESRQEIVYADVMVADSPLRYAVPAGDRRPLYSSASGKAVLAFLSQDEIDHYVEETDFEPITRFTTTKEQLLPALEKARQTALVTDFGGHYVGAMAIASPAFDHEGRVKCAVVVAGPTDRLQDRLEITQQLVREAGEKISRVLGYEGTYPAPQP